MFGSLRKKLNDAWSQADVWDKQENAVQKQQSMKPAPVRTISQPRQVAPATTQRRVNDSYGTGLTGVVNRARDVFDANTQADKIRRFATTGLDETYNQEQARKTQTAMNTTPKRNAVNQASAGGLSGVVDFFGKTPGSLAQLQGRVANVTNDISNPVARTAAKLVVSPSTLFQGKKEADKQIQAGKDLNSLVENKKQQSGIGSRKSDNSWIYGGGQAVTQIPAQLASGGVGLVGQTAQMGADEANKAEAKGKSNRYALGVAAAQAIPSYVSEKWGLDKFLPGESNVTTGLVKNAAKRFLTEGAQEAQQQFTQNLIANKLYDKNQGLKDNVLQSGVLGGLAGGINSVGVDIATPRPTAKLVSNQPSQSDVQMQQRLSAPAPNVNLRPNEANALSDFQDVLTGRVKDVRTINGINQEAYAAAKRNGIDLNTGSSADIQNRINQVLEQPQNNRRFFKPLDNVGSGRIPGADQLNEAINGKIDPLESLKQEAKRFGYDKGYTEEGQIANTIDELMKEQNALREVGIPLYDKYKSRLDGTKTITEMMTPTELKAYRAAEAKSEKASKLLKDYFDYKKGNNQATQSQPPKSTPKTVETETPAQQAVREAKEQGLSMATNKGQEWIQDRARDIANQTEADRVSQVVLDRAGNTTEAAGAYNSVRKRVTGDTKPRGLILSEAKTPGGQTIQKVRTGKGQVETMTDAAYKDVFGSSPQEDAQFNAVAAGSKSASTKRLVDALSQSKELTDAAAQAQQDGKEINFYAKKDKNGRSVGIERFDPKFNNIEAGFVTDKNGNVLGNHIKVDETGMQVNVGGDVVNMENIVGNPQDWKGHYEMSSTMERNIYENAPTKEIADKTYKFVVANKIKNEAVLKTELHDQRQALNQRTKETLAAKPRNVKAKEYKADVFDFVEGKMNQSELVSKYGSDTAQKVNEYKVATRKMYDNLLDRANQVFEQFGEPTVMRRKDYITHINELMSKPSFAGELYGQLQNSFLGEGQTQTRGEIPGNIAGRTENFEPRKKWNRFFQQRKGGEFTKDPFKAVDAYLEPTLYNIHMTEPAVRARAVESAFRTAREIKETDTSHVTEAFDKALDKYKTGNGGGDLVAGFQEYANAVAGKTQRWDRQVVDAGAKSRLALHGWQKLQAIGGRSTVLGNVSSVLAQPLNQVGAVAEAGPINYAKGIAASIGSDKTIEQSPFITARRTDVKSMFRSRGEKIMDVGGVPLQAVEMASVEQAWNAIHQKVKSEGLTGKEAILETDRRTERTVAGRGIADKPELYRSTIANGVLQYTLEVNASNKQFWRDLSPKQKATFLVASTGTNMLMGAVTGFEPLPDFLGAMIDTAKDFFDKDKEGNIAQKSLRGVQRGFGEYVSQNPIASAGANMLPQDTRKSIFGKDAQISRFEGTAAPVQVVKNAVNAGTSLAKGDLKNARDNAVKLVPFGNQIKKTVTGAEMLARGYGVDSKGNKTFDAPTSVAGKAQAIAFGPNSGGSAKEFYNSKNGSTQASTKTNTLGTTDVKDILAGQFDTKEGKAFLKLTDAEKKAAAESDPAMKKMYDQYKTTKRINAANPDHPEGLSKESADILNWQKKRTPQQREKLAYSQNDYDYKLAKAKFEQDTLNGTISRAESINRRQALKKAEIGTKFSKDTREAYNSLSKQELLDFVENDPNGKKIYEDALAYGDELKKAGLIKKNKLRSGSGRGRGKGGSGSKSKYDYTKDLFSKGSRLSTTRALRKILEEAMSGKTKS